MFLSCRVRISVSVSSLFFERDQMRFLDIDLVLKKMVLKKNILIFC